MVSWRAGNRVRLLTISCAVGLSACASGSPATSGLHSLSSNGTIDCVPFARALTGIPLSGDGPEWWETADGRFERTASPQTGAILVFRRTGRLPHGHVSVVSRVLSRREILVTQANWVHGRVTQDQPVADISPRNDWTIVRVWWEPARQLGNTTYPAYGFILPDRPMTHDAIAAATPRAAMVAEGYRP